MPQTLKQGLVRLRKLKNESEAASKTAKGRSAAFKSHQAYMLTRLEAEDVQGLKSGGTQFTVVTKVKGQVEDRGEYVKWALDNDPAIDEFLTQLRDQIMDEQYEPISLDEIRAELYATITSLALLDLKEKGALMNQQANSHVDDGEPLPPGLAFRPDPYISQTNS